MVTATKYAENPIRAKPDLSKNDAHSPSPLIVPIIGPYVRSRYTYDPPLDGIPEDSSALDIAAGRTTAAATMNASQIPAPIMSAAKVGVTNIPGSMAESEMMTTPARPTLRLSVFLIVSVPFSTIESSFEITVELGFEIAITISPIYCTMCASKCIQVNLGYILLHFLRIQITDFRGSDFRNNLHFDSDWGW